MSVSPARPPMNPVDMFRLVRAVSRLLGVTAEQTERAINQYNSEFRTDGGAIRPAYASSRRVATAVGDGVATAYVVTHNLNSRDVLVVAYRSTAPYENITATVERTTVNTVTVTFGSAPTTGQYRVVVIG